MPPLRISSRPSECQATAARRLEWNKDRGLATPSARVKLDGLSNGQSPFTHEPVDRHISRPLVIAATSAATATWDGRIGKAPQRYARRPQACEAAQAPPSHGDQHRSMRYKCHGRRTRAPFRPPNCGDGDDRLARRVDPMPGRAGDSQWLLECFGARNDVEEFGGDLLLSLNICVSLHIPQFFFDGLVR